MSYQHPPQPPGYSPQPPGYPQQPQMPQPQQMQYAQQPQQAFDAVAGPAGKAGGDTPMLLLFVAICSAAFGVVLLAIGKLAAVEKLDHVGHLFCSLGALSLSLSLLWGAYKTLEGSGVRIVAILGGFFAFALALGILEAGAGITRLLAGL